MKIKSKSIEMKPSTAEKHKAGNSYDFLNNHNVNKAFDFVGLYKTAAETSKILEKHKLEDNSINDTSKVKPKRERSPHKNKKKSKQEPIDVSQINIDATSLNSGASSIATPKGSSNNKASRVKSIMKNSSPTDQPVESARSNASSGKPKKRNKSVSFMLEDNEGVVVKRTKSDDSLKGNKKVETVKGNGKDKKKPFKKSKKDQQSEKENNITNVNKQNMDVDSNLHNPQDKKPAKVPKAKKVVEPTATALTDAEPESQDKKKKFKKVKKQNPDSNPETMEIESNNNEVSSESKNKKLKKKKQAKPATEKLEISEGDGEPVPKSRKKDSKPDIAEDLENLSIGDNAHTLTNLLDEMTVVDKDKQKKLKHKFNKNKRPKGPNKDEAENTEEVKEKVKWKKRKWNKDKKGDLTEEGLATTVVVENLPLAIMLNYKKLLTDHFVKFGLIKKVGVAEVYPTEESKPVFTTTINFYSDGAADQALELNNTEFEGRRIHVKRPLPATATTVVVRSYAELTDQNISSTFLSAGKIRSIRHLVKGKKSMSTAFVEFHGPEAVESAIKMAANLKIGGKKMHVAKFEPRTKKKKEKKPKNDGDSAADADSEDSND